MMRVHLVLSMNGPLYMIVPKRISHDDVIFIPQKSFKCDGAERKVRFKFQTFDINHLAPLSIKERSIKIRIETTKLAPIGKSLSQHGFL